MTMKSTRVLRKAPKYLLANLVLFGLCGYQVMARGSSKKNTSTGGNGNVVDNSY